MNDDKHEEALAETTADADHSEASQAPNLDDWTYTGSQLDALEAPPIRMLVPDLISFGLNLLAAKPKQGKSFFALQLAIAIGQGGTFLGHKLERGSVLYFGLEDNPGRLKQRSRDLNDGDPPPDEVRFYRTGNGRIELPEIEDRITKWASQVLNPTLVVIDTLGKVMPHRSSGKTEYAHSTDVIGSLQELALKLGIAILLIHHTNKNHETADDFDQVHGSIGINGAADTILLLNRARGSNVATLAATGRDLIETMDVTLEQRGPKWHMAGVRDYRDILDVPELQLQVLEAVHSGSQQTGAIATTIGTTTQNTSNYIKKLRDAGYLEKVSHGVHRLAPGTEAKLDAIREIHAANFHVGPEEERPEEGILDKDPMPPATHEPAFEPDFGDDIEFDFGPN